MAVSYNPRYELARMLRAQQTGVSAPPALSSFGPARSESSIRLGRTAADLAARYPQLKDVVRQTAAGTAQTKPGGVLGTVLNNPVARVALKPLEALAVPQRVVMSGLEQVYKLGENNGDASWGDFVKNIKDPTYGFGKAAKIDTGFIWLDRALGLGGDIVTDPLTYMTFGGGKFAGAAGRIDLAGIILRNTGDSALAARVAQFGRAAPGLTKEMLLNAGANQHGLYFLGKRIKVGQMKQGLRVPGTGALGAAGERSLHRLRLMASRSKAGTMLQKITMPKDALNARRALLRGEVSDKAAGPIIAFLSGEPLQRRVVGETLQAEEARILSLLDNEKTMGLDVYDDKVFEYIENPELLANASPEIRRAVEDVWGKQLDEYESRVIEAMRELDPNITVDQLRQQGYWPRMVSDRGAEYLQNSNEPFAIRLREIRARDPLANSTNFKMRTMEEGDDFFGTPLTAEDLKSTKRLNEIANAGGFVGDFFETRVSVVFPKYIRSFADEMGLLARHKSLVDGGFWSQVDDIGFMENSVDAELLKAVKKQAQASMSGFYQARKHLVDAFGSLQKTLSQLLEGGMVDEALAARMATLQGLEGSARAIDSVLAGGLFQTEESMNLAVQTLGKLKKDLANLYGAKIVNGKVVFQGADNLDLNLVVNGLVDEASYLEKQILDAQASLVAARESGALTEDIMRQLERDLSKRVSALTTQIDQRTTSIREVMELGNQLESAMVAAINGEPVTGLSGAAEQVFKLMDVAGGQGNVDALLRKVRGIEGELADGIGKDISTPGSMFERTTRLSPITKGAVQKNTTDIENAVGSLFAGSLTLDSARELALAMIYRDRFLLGGNVPPALRAIHDEIETILLKADAASAMANANRKATGGISTGRISARRGFEAEWDYAFGAVQGIQTDIEQLSKLRAVLADARANGTGAGTIDWEKVMADDRLLAEHPVLEYFAPEQFRRPGGEAYDMTTSLEAEDLMGSFDTTAGGQASLLPGGISAGRAPEFPTASTWDEIYDQIEGSISRLESSLDEPGFFVSGRGVSTVRYTGREVLDKMRQYDGLIARRAELLGKREGIRVAFSKKIAELDSKIYDLDGRIDDLETKIATAEEEGLDFQAKNMRRQLGRLTDERNKVWAKRSRLSGEEGEVVTGVRLDAKQEQELVRVNDALREITGGGYQFIEEAGAVASRVQKDLTDLLSQYYAVSEVVKRFNDVATVTEPFGWTPTERAFSSIVQSVANRIMPSIDARIDRAWTLDVTLSQLDEQVAFGIQMAGRSGDGITPHEIFMNAVNALPESAKRALMEVEPIFGIGAKTENGVTTIVGADPQMIKNRLQNLLAGRKTKGIQAVGPDGKPKFDRRGNPVYLRDSEKAALKKDFFEREVRPWFEETFPEAKYNMGEAEKALNAAAGSAAARKRSTRAVKMTPFNKDATPEVIAEWFANRIGNSKVAARRTRVVGGRNILQDRIRELRRARNKVAALLVPDVNPAEFVVAPFSSSKTPWLYGEIIKDKVDQLGRLEFERATEEAAQRTAKEKVAEQAGRVKTAEGQVERMGRRQTPTARPKDLTDQIDRAARQAESWAEANANYTEAETALREIRDEIAELQAQQKRVKGLNKTQAKRLEVLKRKRDAAVIKFNSAKGVLARTAEPTAADAALLDEVARRNPDRFVREYEELTASPLYAKARRDAEMVRVMAGLSQFDLSLFSRGFFLEDGSAVRLADGTPVVFTKDEWDSLFVGGGNFEARKKELGVVNNSLNRQIGALRKERETLTVVLSQAQDRIATGTLSRSTLNRVKKQARDTYRRISIIDSELYALASTRDANIVRIRLMDDTLRASALEKMSVLVHGVDGEGGIFYGTQFDDFISGNHYMQKMVWAGNDALRQAPAETMKTLLEGRTRYENLVSLWSDQVQKLRKQMKDSDDMLNTLELTITSNGQRTKRTFSMRQLIEGRDKAVAKLEEINEQIRNYTTDRAGSLDVDEIWVRTLGPDYKGPTRRELVTPYVGDEQKLRRMNVEADWMESPEYKHMQKVKEAEQGTIIKKLMEARGKVDIERTKLERYQAEYQRLVDSGKVPQINVRLKRGRAEANKAVAEADELFRQRQGRAVLRETEERAEAIAAARKELAEYEAKRQTQLNKLTLDAKKGDAARAASEIKTLDIRISAVKKRIQELETTGLSMRGPGSMDRESMMEFARALQAQSTPQGRFFRAVSEETARKMSERNRNLVVQIQNLWRRHDDIFRMDAEQIGEIAFEEAKQFTDQIDALMKQLPPIERQRMERNRMLWERGVLQREVRGVRADLEQLPAARKAGVESIEADIKVKQERLANVNNLVRALQEGREDTMAELAATLGFWESAQFAAGRITADDLFEFSRRAINEGQGTVDAMRANVELVRKMVEDAPVKQVKEALKRAKGKKLTDAQLDEAMRLYRQWYNEHKETLKILELNPDDPVARAWAAVGLAEEEFIAASIGREADMFRLMDAEMPVWREQVIKPFQDGWEAAARANGLMESTDRRFSVRVGAAKANLAGNAEAIDLLQNIARINNPGTVDDLARVMRGYTGFFRAYATLSPGFHVRNSISNIMSMFTAGAEPKNMVEGFRLWKSFDAAMGYNKTLDDWVAGLAPEMRDRARAAGQIMLGLSHGKTDDALQGFVQQNAKALGEQGSRVRDNAAIRLSRRAGHKADTAARFMLAWDSLAQGMAPDTAFNRTRRYLIDYQSRTMLDDVMRDVVPFWMWVSRNLPLQVVNRWTNPKAYLVYNRFVQNFSQSEEESGTTMPSWLRDMGAVNLGGGLVFNPEFPFSRTDAEIRNLTDPAKLMGYLNPGLRVPVELATGKNFFTGQQTSDEFVPVTGVMSGVLPLLQALGQTQPGPNGTVLAKKSALDALTGLVPPLSRADRFFPSTDRGEGYLSGQIGSFFGVPFRQVSERQESGEEYARLEALRRLAERQRRMEGG